MSKHISWSTEIYAPRHYPIELVTGECFWLYENGGRIGFYTHAGGGWRTAGATAGGDRDIPEGINLTWLAPVEGKYYHARYKLPNKVIERIQSEFERKLTIDRDKEPNKRHFTEMHLARSPGGFVSLRIGWAEVKEIARFQAKEVDISWDYFAMANHFNPEGLPEEEYLSGFTKDLPEGIKQQMKDKTFPTERWKDFCTQKFPWHLATNMDLHGYSQFLINGERGFVNQPKLSEYPEKQAVPAWYRWYFKQDGKRYKAVIRFSQNDPDRNEQPEGDVEIFELFQRYFASSPMPTALVIDMKQGDQDSKVKDASGGELVAYLTNGTKKQELPLYDSSYRLLEDDEYEWFK